MKLTAILFLAACLQVHAGGYAQTKVTINMKSAPLVQVLNEIRKQTGYNFIIQSEWLKKASRVDIQVHNATIEEALDICFKAQPLTYTLTGTSIVIQPRKETPDKNGAMLKADVRGLVTDEESNPLGGASVKIKGTEIGTLTKTDGSFYLRSVDEDADLLISYVGFEIKTIPVKSQRIVAVSLKRNVSKLDEVQIIAYGQTSQRTGTGNVSTIKAVDIQRQPVNNALLALEGRVPGLFITQSTGIAGSGVTVLIQGRNSLGKGNAPLYVIDGVPYPSLLLPSSNSILGSSTNLPGPLAGLADVGTGNPLNFINPADIESMDVLKDADATAIYGSRAANGAILITTKKGKAGKTMVNMNVQNGWGKVARRLDMLNTEQYLELRREGLKNDNIDLNSFPYNNPLYQVSSLPELYAYGDERYTDWQKVLIGGTARYTDAQATVSGGNEHTQILLGAGYHRETTVFPLDFSDQKNSVHFSINHLSTNRKFRAQFSGNYLIDNNELPNADFTSAAFMLPPNAPELYNEDGSLNWGTVVSGASSVSTWDNPLAKSGQNYNYKVNNLLSNAVFGYQLFRGLEIKSSFGYNKLEADEYDSQPLSFAKPENRPTFQRTSIYGRSMLSSWIVEPQATYQINIGKGKLEALVGGTLQRNNKERTQIRGRGFTSDQVMKDIRSATTIQIQSNFASFYKYNAVFGRLNYNWSDKYILNLTARRDGSTRFGSANLFHTFGSVGGAWVFSKEPFLKKALSIINFGKLRGSYGTTGSDQIEDYLFLPIYSTVSSNVSYGGYTGLGPTGLPNPNLQWEETKKLQIGLDLGLFNDRVIMNANYYHNRSSNQLLAYVLPITTGFQDISAYNFPATVQNYGWELSLSTTNIRRRAFSWSSNFNITIPKNKLVSFPNIETSSYTTSLVVGQPITITKVYDFLGVNPTTGLYEVADQNGVPTSNPDPFFGQTAWVNTAPVYYGGFGNNIRYHGFELDFLFQFVKQTGRNNYYGNLPGQYLNQPHWVWDRWKKAGDITDHQKAVSTLAFGSSIASGIVNGSNAAYSDASFIRLKNASLSWELPGRWLKKLPLQQFRLYAQGQNLLTITNYKGLDPENQSLTTLPPLRVITLGVQVKL